MNNTPYMYQQSLYIFFEHSVSFFLKDLQKWQIYGFEQNKFSLSQSEIKF